MNDKEAAERLVNAGITSKDMHDYVFETILNETTYTEDEVNNTIKRVIDWKRKHGR